MGKEQWGHGYFTGIDAAKKNNTGLVGMWVHILKNGKIENQLQIIKELPGDRFLLQYCSFIDGTSTNSKIFSLEQMTDFVFYPNDKEMRFAYHKENPGKHGFEENEEFMERVNRSLSC